MLIERGVIKIGLEIEVAKWDNGRTYQHVAKELVQNNYMLPPASQWGKTHPYHCSCREGGCLNVRNGQLMDVPLVSMTYDSTLPESGAEFIVSPVLLADEALDQLEEIWYTVTKDAIWSLGLIDIKGRPASPSIHLHVSATLQEQRQPEKTGTYSADILHALSLFTPEFFALADRAGLRRGLTYRLPTRKAMELDPQGDHHGFLQVRRARPGTEAYIEWRLFEAAYTDWNYVQSSAYIAATLTRALLQEETLKKIFTQGYQNPLDDQAMQYAIDKNDVGLLLKQINPDRLAALRSMCAEQIDDDNYGYAIVMQAFDQVEEMIW